MEDAPIVIKRREDNISSSSDSSGFFEDKNIISKHGSFSAAFEKQNNCMDSAIKSLDTLNEQIVQFVFTPKSSESQDGGCSELTARERETLRSSMGVMRRLLVDAQVKFRKMVDDNRALAGRIDGSIQTANEEVNALRNELLDTNKRLSQLSHMTLSSSLNGSEQTIGSPNMHSSVEEALHTKDIPNNDHLSSKPPISPIISNRETERIADLEKENSALQLEIHALHKDIKELKQHKEHGETPDRELEARLTHTQHDLARALEAVQAMREDRKRLKAEKLDLLGQLKQLYSNLEDKETELRHFIRSYEQRMRETDDSVKQLVSAKDSIEQEKAEFLLRTQKAEQRADSLQSQVDTRQQMIDTLSQQLKQFREQLRSLGFAPPLAEDDMASLASSRDVSKTPSMNSLQVKDPSSQRVPQSHAAPTRLEGSRNCTPLGSMTSLHSNNSQAARDCSHTSLDQITEQSTDPTLQVPTADGSYVTVASDMHIVERRQRPRDNSKDRRRKSPGPFSRMFGGKTRSRRSIAVLDPNDVDVPDGCVAVSSRLSLLTQDNYQEKLSLVSQALSLPVATWRASHVLAWLEVDMNMPSYGRDCGRNIKSGKVLLGLSDTELESALSLGSHLHRRKLRLAIEDLRDPSNVMYPKACRLDHTWVAHRLLPDLGLPQYCLYFEEQLVDGRLLSVLTRKDLEKHLCIQRKFHQASLLHAIELLRRVNFDKEVLHQRRVACETQDSDPLVWTNLRLLKWLRSIDLEEYTENLKESGVHGAVLVLEPTFTADAFAAALGISASKSYVRRHLATELEALVRPARLALESHGAKKSKPPSSGGSLGRSFSRSFRSSTTSDGPRRRSLRGSFGRAFSRHKSKAAHSSPPPANSDPTTQTTPLDVGKRSLSLELRSS